MNREKLTIVLTIKERKKYTKRYLDWLSLQNCPFRIIIADGDLCKNYTKRILECDNYKNLSITYIEYDYDKDLNCYMKKLADVSKEVRTDFVIYADNDDFLLIDNLIKAVDIIDKNKNIGTLALSHYRLKIHAKDNSLNAMLSAHNSQISIQKLKRFGASDIVDSNSQIRLLSAIKNFPSDYIYYGIHRTDQFIRINNDLSGVVSRYWIFGEFYQTYAFALSGRIYAIEAEPFLVRQENTSYHASQLVDSEKLSRLIVTDSWGEHRKNLALSLWKLLIDKEGDMNKREFYKNFYKNFDQYVSKVIRSARIANFFRPYQFFFRILRSINLRMRGRSRVNFRHQEVRKNESLLKLINFIRE